MRFLMMIKSTQASEAGVLPTRELVEAPGRFDEEMVQAGVLRAVEGLKPSSEGVQVSFSSGDPEVTEGPTRTTHRRILAHLGKFPAGSN